MIKKLLVLLITLVCLNTKAQTNLYYPLPEANTYWNENTWGTDFNHPQPYITSDNYTLFYSNDTLINSIAYHKILKSGYTNTYPNINNFYSNVYVGALRQDSAQKKVYFIYLNDHLEQLLYNFNLTVGDTLPNHNQQWNIIQKIDSVLVGNFFHKRFLLQVLGNTNHIDTTIAIIEGVGSIGGLYNLFEAGESGSHLHCFGSYNQNYPTTADCLYITDINKVNFKNDITIYPNPSNGSFQVTVNNEQATEIKIYDIAGKLVLSQSINGNATIHANTLNEGIYTISISNSEDKANKKLVIIR